MTQRKIAILRADEIYDNYNDCYRKIVESISEWAVVSEDEYKLLKDYSYERGFQIIEVPLNQEEFVRETVAALLVEAEAKRKAEEAKRAKEKAKREANRAKQAAQAREKKLKQFQQLQQELGINITP